jgi:hypothetical protein
MIKNFKKFVGFAAVAAFVATAALAQQGTFGGYTSATSPLTGAETVPMDSNLSGGRSPQTEKATVAQIKEYVLGGVANPATLTAAATAGAATLNAGYGVITSEALTTAAAAVYTLTWTNSAVAATSLALCSVGNGTNTTVGPSLAGVTPGAGSLVVVVRNTHASSALNGTIKVACAFIN